MQLNIEQMNILFAIVRNAEAMIKSRLGVDVALEAKQKSNTNVTAEMLLPVIADALTLSPTCFITKSRKSEYVLARFIAARLIRYHYPLMSLQDLAGIFGRGDHTAAKYMLDTANTLLETKDPIFCEMYVKAQNAVESFVRS